MNFPIVSSNTLFHFTNKREHLLNILKNDFRPRFGLEDISSLKTDVHNFSYAFPMSCFCDLPLSNTSKHLADYGNYGIGLTKKWGKEKGLNPILYLHKDSNLWADIDISIFKIIEDVMQNKPLDYELTSGINRLMFFMKPYEGDFVHRGINKKDVRFYDEREWRFVPIIDEKHVYFLSKEQFEDNEIRERHNENLPDSATLKFTPNDIRYIIVEREDEILEMMNEIMRLKGSHYTYDDVKLLQTRIISAEQIREDF